MINSTTFLDAGEMNMIYEPSVELAPRIPLGVPTLARAGDGCSLYWGYLNLTTNNQRILQSCYNPLTLFIAIPQWFC